ncbi:SRPBCC family protein [Noviherbaspirillum cavernae]|nr:SRPBCC family protein [Noviherbaspirillum cavernae]
MVSRASKDGHTFFEISAKGFVQAAPQQAWRVLTGYERLPEFVPNLRSSKLVARNGNEVILEQESTAGFLFVAQGIHLVLRVTEQPYSAIDIAMVDGDMKHYSARWELTPVEQNGVAGTRITYAGTMEPGFFILPIVGDMVVEKDVKEMMNAVAAEIDRTARVK